MARMIPDRLRLDTKSNAEKLLYYAFQEQLPDGIVVFHHVPWQQPNLRRGARDGEADFVIADPRQGILIIEVKGGAVRYEGREGRWYSGIHAIDDPFEQAVTSKYSLLNFLKEQSFWRSRWITMGHAVAFPDAVVNQAWLRPDAPRTIVLDHTQVSDVHTWVRQLFQHWRGQEARDGAPEAAGVENLVSLLSPSIDFRPLLGTTIADEAQELLRLSEKQFQLLDFLGRHRQAAITGCAGSGKTVLAVEKARRLSRQGFKVLLTCFNRNLAYFLQESLQDEQGLHVAHFHGLCSDLAHQAGLLSRENRPRTISFFNETLPELLVQAADALDWHVDAIIVDEGQDFREDWWIPLRYLLNDPDHGIIYVFFDDNQNLYRTKASMPLEVAPHVLTENCRNTQAIHSYIRPLYRSDHSTSASGPEGRPVEIVHYATLPELKRLLRQQIHRLVREERISSQDIIILTPLAPHRSALSTFGTLGEYALTDQPGGSGEIFWTNIYQFKGLESPVVILVEMETGAVTDHQDFTRGDDQPPPSSSPTLLTLDTLMYVGASRACHHLILMSPN